VEAPPEGGAGRSYQEACGTPGSTAPAPDPQGQVCVGCGAPGHPPRIGDPQPTDLTIRPLLGRLALICRECTEVAALDHALRARRVRR
jgi:hypothetical protein